MIPYRANPLGINYNKIISGRDVEILKSIRDANPQSTLLTRWPDSLNIKE